MPDDAEGIAAHTGEALQVGDWTVDPALNQVSAAGKTVRLEPKAMALLAHLAERPGEVVSRDALLAAVWPGVVVGDDSLTQAIIKLRKALGDTPESPVYIQTIAKRGYRLVAPVTKARPLPEPEAVRGPSSKQSIRSHALGLSVAGFVALLLVAGGIWWLIDQRESPLPSSIVAGAEASRAAKPAIRIASFEPLGEDPQAVLLARGMTADLVTDLSKVFELSVIAEIPRSDQAVDAKVEQASTVRYLVSGSVQRIGDQVRLNVNLADVQTGTQLWSERFDRYIAGLFALQDELVPKLLRILPAKVSEAELRRVAQHHTRNLEAYQYYQRGQMALLVRRQEENELAKEMFQRAIALDASFALPYAALAQTYAGDHRNGWTNDRNAALERAFELARTAHAINPDVRETYWVLAFVHLERGQHAQAFGYLETAIRLYPSYADAYALMGGIYAYLGEPAQALPLLRTAIRLRPEAGHLYFLNLGRAYFGLGDLEQARINLEHAILRNPANVEARVYAAATHLLANRSAEAEWEAQEIRVLQSGFARDAWMSTHPLKDNQVRKKLLDALAALRL